MTELELRNNVVEIIEGWVGARKGDRQHAEILNAYNAHKPLARSYAVKPADDYCATTVSATYIMAGIAEYTGTECGVDKYAQAAKKLGCWVEDDSYRPKIGDACVYDWQDNGIGDNQGWADHIGIVTSVTGNKFVVTEGNMSGGVVGKRTMEVNGKTIRGFIAPPFAKIAREMGGKEIPYRSDVQRRFGFDDNTMKYLDGHPYPEALYKKLATKA